MLSPSLLSIKTHGSPQNLFYEKYIRLVKEDNYEEIFTLLAEKMSEQDSKGKVPKDQSTTLLHISCENGAVKIISKLLIMISLLKKEQYDMIDPLCMVESNKKSERPNTTRMEKMDKVQDQDKDLEDLHKLTPYKVLMKFIIGCQDGQGNLPFHTLAKQNDPRCTEILKHLFGEMNSYNDFDHRDNKLRGKSKLNHNYFHNDHYKYIDMQNINGLTPLHLACINGCLSNVTLLLQEGANRWSKIKVSNNALIPSKWEGMNALHLAVLHAPSPIFLSKEENDDSMKKCNASLQSESQNSYDPENFSSLLPLPFVDKEWSSPYHCIIDHLVYKLDFNNNPHVSINNFDDNVSFVDKNVVSKQTFTNSHPNNRQPSFSSYSLAEVEFLEGKEPVNVKNIAKSYIDSQNQQGQTSLHLAALTGNTNLLKLLLQKYKANAFIADFLSGASPLHYALYGLEMETKEDKCHLYDTIANNVKLLIENNFNLLWQCDEDGMYPLHLACYYRHESIVKAIANILRETKSKDRNISSFVDNNRLNVLHYLLKRWTKFFNTKFQRSIGTILEVLCHRDITSSQLIKQSAETSNLRSSFSLLQLLVENEKLDINTQDKNGFSPLHYICNSDHPTDNITILTYFLLNGADIESRSSVFGLTPLHIACITGNTAKTAALINQGASIETETFIPLEQNVTLSGYIQEQDKFENQKDSSSSNLSIVSKLELSDLFVQYTATIWKNNLRFPPLSQIIFGNVAYRFSTDSLFTPLHLCCIFGNLDTAEYLIFKGASINAKTYNCQSPLHMSVLFRNTDCVRMLLHRNARISNFFPNSWDIRSLFLHPIFTSLFWKLDDIFPLHLLIEERRSVRTTKDTKHRNIWSSLKAYILGRLPFKNDHMSESMKSKDIDKSNDDLDFKEVLNTWFLLGQKEYNQKQEIKSMQEAKLLNSKIDATAAGTISEYERPANDRNEKSERKHRRKDRRLLIRERYSRYRRNLVNLYCPSGRSLQSQINNISKVLITDFNIISIILSNQFLRLTRRVSWYLFEKFENVNIMMTIYVTTLTQAVNKYWQTSSSSLA